MFDVHLVLLFIGFLLLVCVLLSKFTAKIGVPALLIFLIVGLILDTNQFISSSIADYNLIQSISIFALIIIMFSGGLDTELANIKRGNLGRNLLIYHRGFYYCNGCRNTCSSVIRFGMAGFIFNRFNYIFYRCSGSVFNFQNTKVTY